LRQARDHFLASEFTACYRLCHQALLVFDLNPLREEPLVDTQELLAWLDLASACSYRLGMYVDAERWLGLAMAVRHRCDLRLEDGQERLALTYIALGQPDRAVELLVQAERLKKRYYDPEQTEKLVPTLEAQVALALSSGRYPMAERFAKRAVARAPEPGVANSRALCALARVLWYQDRSSESQAICEQLLHHGAPTLACERWHWSHAAVSQALVGDLDAAEASARTLGTLLDPHDRSLLLGWRWLGGQLASLRGNLDRAVELWEQCREAAAELYPGVHFQRALVAHSLAAACWDKREVDRALEFSRELLELCPAHWFGGQALRALGLELQARCLLGRGETSQALELTGEALQSLRGEDNLWQVTGAGGVVHWHDGLDDEEPGTWMPLCWPLGALSSERELLARALATRAKALRQADWPEQADATARLARSVRESVGTGLLIDKDPQGLSTVRSGIVKLSLRAPGRRPYWVTLESDGGTRNTVGVEGADGAIVLAEGHQRRLLQPDAELFSEPLPDAECQLQFLVTQRGARRVGLMPYMVTIGFQTGPPLRIPVRD
jgi:tetratricopeptide (TPR) repeat protein